MNWLATNRRPIYGEKDFDEIKLANVTKKPTKKAREQLKAAKVALGHMLDEFEGPVNVSLSGYAAKKGEDERDVINVTIAQGEE